MNDRFSGLHPVIHFTYFTAVIFCSMFFMHPVFLAVSLVCSFIYSIYLNKGKAIKFNFLFLLPMMLVFIIVNPLINHAGMTILLYINDHPITLEAIYYGIASAAMFAAVLAWFSCCNALMPSDKIIYLFGRIMPSLSLIFTMVMRFVPRYKTQVKAIATAQTGIGKGMRNGNILNRAKNGMTILSILTTWALENGIQTADSMRARGYGLPGRSSFSVYRFDSRDKAVLVILLALVSAVFAGSVTGQNTATYFPIIILNPITGFSTVVYTAYALLCLFPFITNLALSVRGRSL